MSPLAFADVCKPIDTYFSNTEQIKHCVSIVMNDMGGDKRKLFKSQPDCVRTAKLVDANRAEIEKMDSLLARQCFAPYFGDLPMTKQIYIMFNNFR